MISNYMTCHYKYFLLNISWIGGAALSSVNRCICLYTVLLGPDLILCHHKQCLIAISKKKSQLCMAACTLTITIDCWPIDRCYKYLPVTGHLPDVV